MDVLDRIILAMQKRGMKQKDLCEAIGLDAKNFTAWKSGLSKSYIKYIYAIADVLGEDVEYLRTGEGRISPEITADNFVYVGEIKKTKKIGLLGTIACGDPITMSENMEEMIYPPYDVECTFALTCKGDSMIDARIYNGDIVYIKQQPDVDDGEIAAVRIGSEATLKKVYHYPDKVVLSPCNPRYSDIVLTGDAEIIGKAVAFQSKVRS